LPESLAAPCCFGGWIGWGATCVIWFKTVNELRTCGVALKVLTGAGAQIDMTTANGRLAFGIFTAFADSSAS
jgi:DNA invertase Pin-like site-specific DNA recombinase